MSDKNNPKPKPKLRLRLSIGKTKKAALDAAKQQQQQQPKPVAVKKSTSTKPTTSSSSNNNNNGGSNNSNPSRGKELPAAIKAAATQKQQQQQQAKSSNNKQGSAKIKTSATMASQSAAASAATAATTTVKKVTIKASTGSSSSNIKSSSAVKGKSSGASASKAATTATTTMSSKASSSSTKTSSKAAAKSTKASSKQTSSSSKSSTKSASSKAAATKQKTSTTTTTKKAPVKPKSVAIPQHHPHQLHPHAAHAHAHAHHAQQQMPVHLHHPSHQQLQANLAAMRMPPNMVVPHHHHHMPPPMQMGMQMQQQAVVTSVPMTTSRKYQCLKVISALRRRHTNSEITWFLRPVNDTAAIAADYRSKIPHPCDLSTLTSRLSSANGYYATVDSFVLDLRRMFSNALRYNTIPKDKIRTIAISLLEDVEGLLSLFIARTEAPKFVYPSLVYCWKQCIAKLNIVLSVKNTTADQAQTAHYFLHPVSYYYSGEFPPGYLKMISRPMDFGTIVSKLLEGEHQSVGAFAEDCRFICENCKKFNGSKPEMAIFVEQGNRLNAVMSEEIGALIVSDQQRGPIPQLPPPPTRMATPPKELLRTILRELRATTYTSRITKAILRAMTPFEKPVDLKEYPDYTKYVETPMDLSKVERRIEEGVYLTPDDFEFDCLLIFENCEKYNTPKKHIDIVTMAKHGARSFKKILSSYLKKLESGKFTTQSVQPKQPKQPKPVPTAAPSKGTKRARSPTPSITSTPKAQPSAAQPATKKLKTETGAVKSIARTMHASKEARRPANVQGAQGEKANSGPVPLSVSIERVKQTFSTRRVTKNLEPWEVACARILTALSKHPWLSGSVPRFLYHVPVPILFPEIAEAYKAKIAKPMDLTTVEGTLLQGGIFKSPQEFIDNLSLVFSNAISFNQAGHDEGDPMSCAYFEASQHLLFYTRMLSLEHLSGFLVEASGTDLVHIQQGAYSGWKLTKEFKKAAKQEMESLVLNIQMEKSDITERLAWWELECEKLLKALRHQSDLRYMTFFIHTTYPADYAAYVSKPIDWNDCSRNLQDRTYDTIGMCVEDIRLIFSNAVKYNARAKGTDTVSGQAYAAAVYMSAKLEAAVDRMLLTVSERLGRDKVESAIQRREKVAQELAEEEKARAEGRDIDTWRAERDRKKAEEEAKKLLETRQTIKVNLPQRAPTYREYAESDFDPFEEDDDAHHEQAYIEAAQRERVLYMKQQKERKETSKIACKVGIGVFARLAVKKQLRESYEQKEKIRDAAKPEQNTKAANLSFESDQKNGLKCVIPAPSKVKTAVRDKKIQMILGRRRKKNRQSCIFD